MPATLKTPKDPLTAFCWEPQPKAAALVKSIADDFLAKVPEAMTFADRLYRGSGNRFTDLIETIAIPNPDDATRNRLTEAGWRRSQEPAGGGEVWRNASGIFPAILFGWAPVGEDVNVFLKVESVADFLAAHGIAHRPPDGTSIWGEADEAWRYADVWHGAETCLLVSERHGYNGYDTHPRRNLAKVARVAEMFRLRGRDWLREEDGFRVLESEIDAEIREIGRDDACALFFAAEREYWQRRNRAAQWQKARQDRLGIGWVNHDHHTYRSSRRHFHRLITLWEKLGFQVRERFYPGPEAGWGAQVMEQPVCGIVTFNDVDISPDELRIDFAHEPMQKRDTLGTVGLWCALHGESVLQAGMHHLECTFDFEALREQMEHDGLQTMRKFTDFPYLKQAFTEGERWPVAPARIDALLEAGRINQEQAERFRTQGAIGSHLENLERNDGYKGFNQDGVTAIIHGTDPRRQ